MPPTDTDAMQQVLNANPDQSEALRTYFDYKRRYQKQLGRTADLLAPTNRTGNRRKQYRTLNTFIRAMLIQELKATKTQENTPQPDKNA